MDNVKMLTQVYLDAYMYALEVTKNPNLAVGAAMAVTMVMSNKPQETPQNNFLNAVMAHIISEGSKNRANEKSKKEDGKEGKDNG